MYFMMVPHLIFYVSAYDNVGIINLQPFFHPEKTKHRRLNEHFFVRDFIVHFSHNPYTLVFFIELQTK